MFQQETKRGTNGGIIVNYQYHNGGLLFFVKFGFMAVETSFLLPSDAFLTECVAAGVYRFLPSGAFLTECRG
jgi:hypothetical protein